MLIDRLLQRFRLNAIAPYLKSNDFVLDIGTDDGAFFNYFKNVRNLELPHNLKLNLIRNLLLLRKTLSLSLTSEGELVK